MFKNVVLLTHLTIVESLVLAGRHSDLEFSRLESWSRGVSRPVFTSLGLGLGLEPRSLGLGLGLGTLQSRSRSRSWDLRQWRLGLRHS